MCSYESGIFDAVVDFAAAVSDPADPRTGGRA
jgi:hypothetical protein